MKAKSLLKSGASPAIFHDSSNLKVELVDASPRIAVEEATLFTLAPGCWTKCEQALGANSFLSFCHIRLRLICHDRLRRANEW